VDDYYDLNRQTVLLTAVEVTIYDTTSGREIFKRLVRSDDGGRTLANESRSRKYVGNFNRIWNSIATQVPNEVF